MLLFSRMDRVPGKTIFSFLRHTTFHLLLGWTVLIAGSFLWNSRVIEQNVLERARIEARTLFELNLLYRRWAAGYGGVYVPVSSDLKPNPYLKVPHRDVTTTTGRRLTLVNPAWMTRQVFELAEAERAGKIHSHITSLKHLNPVNRPDPWEESALRSIETGTTEVSEVTTLGGAPHMRLIRPLVTEQSCLTCHGHQKYQVGDVRGGISIAVPLQPFLDTGAHEKSHVLFLHLLLWTVGGGGIVYYGRRNDQQRETLAEQGRRYRLLFDSNPHPMWVYDLETLRFLMVNNAAVRHYGYSFEEFLSMTIADIRPPEDIPGLLKNVSRVVEGIDYAGTWRHRKKDGTIIFVDIISHVLELGGRKAELVMAHDITTRVQLEEQLRQAQKMEAVGQLAGGLAHDFNNILTAIMGYGNVLQMKMRQDDPLRSYVEQVITASEKAAMLTQSLLTFSRKQVITLRPLGVNEVLSRMGRILQRLLREDIELRVDLSEEDLVIMADSTQLEQVLMNLVTNARDAMPEGGVLSIRCGRMEADEQKAALHSLKKAGSYAVITISDTGIGMTEKVREKIFEPFFTTKELGKGTGLGLAMAYGIITQHGGQIFVESEPGKGSTFFLYFPLTVREESREKRISAAVPLLGGTETLLVAEDDATIRQLMASVLREFGYTVIEAVDGEDALRKFSEKNPLPRMLILDVIMPRKNGKTVFNEIRKDHPGIKALFISGYTADTIPRKEISEDNLHLLSKPVSLKVLLGKVREILDS